MIVKELDSSPYFLRRHRERDVRRIEALTEVLTVASGCGRAGDHGRAGQPTADVRLGEDGRGGLICKGRGQSSNQSASASVREYVLELIKSKYTDFAPTLATEVLLAKPDIQVGRETLRTWMFQEGLWQLRKQRRSFHQPRFGARITGELIQIHGSDRRWMEQRGEPCTLLVFINDATSKLMQLRFVPSESTDSYFEALSGYLRRTRSCRRSRALRGRPMGRRCGSCRRGR